MWGRSNEESDRARVCKGGSGSLARGGRGGEETNNAAYMCTSLCQPPSLVYVRLHNRVGRHGV